MPTIPLFKSCSKCGQEYLNIDDNFRPNKSGLTLRSECRQCETKRAQTNYWKHPEHCRLVAVQRYWSNPELARERARISNKRQRLLYPARVREIQRRSERKNPEVKRAGNRRWQGRNPVKLRVQVEIRRARKRNAEGHYSAQDLRDLYEYQDGRCIYCGIRLFDDVPGDVHTDHVLALSRGGTNWPDNLVLACITCNDSKGIKTIREWQAVRGW